MKIFLDDVRVPKNCVGYMHQRIGNKNPIYLEEWVIVRNYNEFVSIISRFIDSITHISFDHDLEYEITESPEPITEDNAWAFAKTNENAKTGYDCARWMKEYYDNKGKKYPILFVHSMNPVGTERIIKLFER